MEMNIQETLNTYHQITKKKKIANLKVYLDCSVYILLRLKMKSKIILNNMIKRNMWKQETII